MMIPAALLAMHALSIHIITSPARRLTLYCSLEIVLLGSAYENYSFVFCFVSVFKVIFLYDQYCEIIMSLLTHVRDALGSRPYCIPDTLPQSV